MITSDTHTAPKPLSAPAVPVNLSPNPLPMSTPTFDAEALKARFNPDGSPLRRMQDRMTEMLREIDAICRRHNIRYWLCSGTLLGCIRHGGYIPWDDDLDIEVLREDYDRLMEILPRELPEHLRLQNHDTDPGYFFCFAKVRDTRSHLSETNDYDRIFRYRGIFIDIFPYEKMPLPLLWISNRTFGRIYKVMRNPEYNIQQLIRKTDAIYRFNHRWVFPVLRFLAKLWPTQKLNYSPGIPYDNTIYAHETFPLKRADFDGFSAPIPADSDAYLRRKFGNYMHLPDLDTIHQHSAEFTIDD